MSDNPKRRLILNIAESTYQALSGLAERRGKTPGQVLADAISLELWIEERQGHGATLLLHEDDETRELVLR